MAENAPQNMATNTLTTVASSVIVATFLGGPLDEVAVTFRFALGTIFLISGIAKLPNLHRFEEAVTRYRVLPAVFTRAVVLVIPPAEAVAGILLLTGLELRATAVGVALLLVVFSTAILVNLLRGRRVSCGCFGTLSQREISWLAVLRNIALIVVASQVAYHQPSVLTLSGLIERSPPSTMSAGDGIALMIVGTLAAFLISLAQEAGSVERARRRLAHAGFPR